MHFHFIIQRAAYGAKETESHTERNEVGRKINYKPSVKWNMNTMACHTKEDTCQKQCEMVESEYTAQSCRERRREEYFCLRDYKMYVMKLRLTTHKLISLFSTSLTHMSSIRCDHKSQWWIILIRGKMRHLNKCLEQVFPTFFLH